MGHASSTHVSCQQLVLQLGCALVVEYVCEVAQLICSTGHKLVQFDELRHITVLCRQSLLEWIILSSDLIVVFPLLTHLVSFAISLSLILLPTILFFYHLYRFLAYLIFI